MGAFEQRRRFVLPLCAALLFACAAETEKTSTVDIPVLVPISGPESARGEAVLKVALLMNEKLDALDPKHEIARFVPADANLDPTQLQALIKSHNGAPAFVVGDCETALAVQAQYGGDAPTTIAIHCETRAARAKVEARDSNQRFYWIGPTILTFLDALEAQFRTGGLISGGQASVSADLYAFSNAVVVFTSTDIAESDSADIDRMIARSNVLNPALVWKRISIPPTTSTRIPSYADAIDNLHFPTMDVLPRETMDREYDEKYVFLTPWLTTSEFVRQTIARRGADVITGFQALHGPLGYLTENPATKAYPTSFENVRNIEFVGAVDVAAYNGFRQSLLGDDAAAQLSMLSSMSADTFSLLALASASAKWSEQSFGQRFVALGSGTLTGASASKATFLTLDAALTAAREGSNIDFEGIFSNFKRFDAQGQLYGQEATLVTVGLNEAGERNRRGKQQFPVLPLVGVSVDMLSALRKGCVSVTRPEGSLVWEGSPAFLFDYIRSSALQRERSGVIAVNLRFNQPLDVTGVTVYHLPSPSRLDFRPTTTRVALWPALGQPESSVTRVSGEWAADRVWVEMQWPFAPKATTEIEMSVLDNNDFLPFGEVQIFATEESAERFCP